MKLHQNEMFSVEIEKNYIKLTPMAVIPKYSQKELAAIERIVEKERKKGKRFKAGSDFDKYVRNLSK